MIHNKSVLAIIPARGGSKGIPRKNITLLGKKPLIAWTIQEAKASKFIDRLVLSSDDEEIIRVAGLYGCDAPFIRPEELSRDETPGIDVVLHAITTLPEQYDYVVLLQPTSPFRKCMDIDNCIQQCHKKNAPFCVSLAETEESPYWMFSKNNNELIQSLIKTDKSLYQRQLLPKTYILNGAVYVGKTSSLTAQKTFITPHTIGYTMPKLRSIDIDTEADLKYANFLLKT